MYERKRILFFYLPAYYFIMQCDVWKSTYKRKHETDVASFNYHSVKYFNTTIFRYK